MKTEKTASTAPATDQGSAGASRTAPEQKSQPKPAAKHPTLTAEQLAAESCQSVTAYAHPHTARTVAYHFNDYAYTATGLPAGAPDAKAAQ